ncbi:hypothetical protein Q4F19_19410 [Sphingomonas sp. BIUV-7]|uniref:Flagellar protein FlgN n=1 Tax=Sphingomonas natans TaxID=3063330 RepID=A0ABT8YE00_9SPHN|nr:hypothetical protein [Sphingomonas sp. BIUV-7]MDO6416560.1 hypothetical protein [Sphingomonas sp. BIUV-7]
MTTAAALEGLMEREEALVAALDANDVGGIERATSAIGQTLTAIVATAGWHESHALGERVTQALRLAEAAGGRIHYLADANRRRIDRLVSLAGQPRAEAYARSGRHA